jgi:peptidyl-prolyl cis-trans isomerase B (cyclophilin B)
MKKSTGKNPPTPNRNRLVRWALVIAAVIALLVLRNAMQKAANRPPEPPPAPPPPAPARGTFLPPSPAEIDAARTAGRQTADIQTERGTIVVQLDGAAAPLTVANFVKLAKAGFYNGAMFYRVEDKPEFRLIQGGRQGNGPGYSIKDEQSPRRHVAGAVAMAKTIEPDSAASEFYICINPIPQLDNRYTVFGKVVKGLDVAAQIRPDERIEKITIR